MIGTHCIVEDDLYGIAARVKEIDSAYFIVRNYRRKRFELHVSNQIGGTLALVVPFDRLDARTVALARKTRTERADVLIRQMEQENAQRERRVAHALLKRITEQSVS